MAGFRAVWEADGGWWRRLRWGSFSCPSSPESPYFFFDSEKKWAWVLAGLGLAVVAIEILSRVRFVLEMKTTHLLLVLGMVAAGAGLILRSYVISAPDDQDNANKS
ncbi:hypothetical protein N9821_00485 [Akkermansiaceae bacterium]|nr:hypothetical protein [Akkermansiaceae bacterium]